uniref:Uncharacterized protein n=1 Tax=Panagrolaimus davidi TaxID=227884 RepID=A0A914PM12_9BILA
MFSLKQIIIFISAIFVIVLAHPGGYGRPIGYGARGGFEQGGFGGGVGQQGPPIGGGARFEQQQQGGFGGGAQYPQLVGGYSSSNGGGYGSSGSQYAQSGGF